ncbi:NAD(P)(+)--arginine ADP-ribosyltransferase 1-like [Carassius carassius]|uniref:NAD(P)(+)--arginine ADP-ribosyltransferase 1-like n=1 Tax=Carassius carassius TaxID=217509 RepID=UPI002868BDE4|nr:NAD(P)(+)--arginine ADP-ribosyltransferase 1-like [Carassius carassius]
MLLIIEALLLISAALGKDHRAAVKGKIFPLDMALDSVDDQYENCRDRMAEKVKKVFLNNEKNNSPGFKIAWEKAGHIVKNHTNLSKNHLIALYVYSDSNIYTHFNPDTRFGNKRYKQQTYKWYSLHFLLTEAIEILKTTEQNACFYTYRRTKAEFSKDVLNKEVRFGQFASSSIDRDKGAKVFGTVSCFEIYTCEGANITKYSKLAHEEEVLIPPYEKFKVIDVKRKGQRGAWCDTVYVLNSTGTRSDLNCALFKKPAKT